MSVTSRHTRPVISYIPQDRPPKERRNSGRESRRRRRRRGMWRAGCQEVWEGDRGWSRREISRWRLIAEEPAPIFSAKRGGRMSSNANIERIMNNSRRRFSYMISRRADSSNGFFVETKDCYSFLFFVFTLTDVRRCLRPFRFLIDFTHS